MINSMEKSPIWEADSRVCGNNMFTCNYENNQQDSAHLKRRQLASKEKWASEQILKTGHLFHNLHRLWKTVKEQLCTISVSYC